MNTRVLFSLVGSVVLVSQRLIVLMARPYSPAEPGFPNPLALSLHSWLSVAHSFVYYLPFERFERHLVAPPGHAQPYVVPTA